MVSTALVTCLTGTSVLVALINTSGVSATSDRSLRSPSAAEAEWRKPAAERPTNQLRNTRATNDDMIASLCLEGCDDFPSVGSPDSRIAAFFRLPSGCGSSRFHARQSRPKPVASLEERSPLTVAAP